MRITILTYGSRGDVQPLVALGCGLQRSGHQVRLAAPPQFEPLARRAGMTLAPVEADIRDVIGTALGCIGCRALTTQSWQPDASRLAAAIALVTHDSEMRRRAEALGRQIRGEASVGTAVNILEHAFS